MLSHGPKHTCITWVTDQCRLARPALRRCRSDNIGQGADLGTAAQLSQMREVKIALVETETSETQHGKFMQRKHRANFTLKEGAAKEHNVIGYIQQLLLKKRMKMRKMRH